MRVPDRAAAAPAPRETVPSGGSYGIRADLLIPGRGDPVEDGAMVVKDGRIEWVGPYAERPAALAATPFAKVDGAVLPGLWDVHCHYQGVGVVGGLEESGPSFLPGFECAAGAATVDDLRATLMAGFTSVRELGGVAGYLQPLIARGRLVGPTVYSALSLISITGGHGDQHDAPLAAVRASWACGGGHCLADGVDECTRRVRELVRRGARVIKICSTGGVLSLNDQPEDSQFSPAELDAIVQEAARSGRAVASHAIGRAGIVAALRAGVRSVEHGMYLDDEVAALMRAKGAVLVPTRHIVESLAADPAALPPPVRAKMERLVRLSRESLALAVRAGVRVALGTDTYNSDPAGMCAHGANARELHWLAAAGMTPLQAIEAATATPPETLGPQAPRAGQLREGYDADFIAVAGNPLEDLEVLTRPDNITHVWKGGRLFKSP